MDDLQALVLKAYQRWEAGDVDGLLSLFHDNAKFFIPGSTPVSGDHDKASFRAVLETVTARTAEGSHSQHIIDSYVGTGGVSAVLDNVITRDGEEIKYHSMHLWEWAEGDKLSYWWLFVHEYKQFERAWG